MGCNCKKTRSFEEKHGVAEEETLLGKFNRRFIRTILFIIAIAFVIVLLPIIMFVAIYKICFGNDNRITLPKFMRKYLE